MCLMGSRTFLVNGCGMFRIILTSCHTSLATPVPTSKSIHPYIYPSSFMIIITFFITGASNSADRKEVSSSFSSSLFSSTTWEYNNNPKDFKISGFQDFKLHVLLLNHFRIQAQDFTKLCLPSHLSYKCSSARNKSKVICLRSLDISN